MRILHSINKLAILPSTKTLLNPLTMNDKNTRPLQLPPNITAPFYRTESLFRKHLKEDMDKLVLGGGTVLAMHWQHRISTDLDYFVSEKDQRKAREIIEKIRAPLRELHAENVIQHLDESANHLKFFVYETETTVFTTLSHTLEIPTHHERQSGLNLENTTEILAKKLRGRILGLGDFATRDFYDFCVACHEAPDSLNKCLATATETEIEAICHELKRWRSSEPIKAANKGKLLIEPRYPAIANNLWSHSENVFRTQGIPEHLFVSTNKNQVITP